VALEKLKGVSAAYINYDINILYANKSDYDAKKIEEALAPFKMKVLKTTSTLGSPFTEPAHH